MSESKPKTAYFRRIADDLIIGVPVDSPEYKRARTETDADTHEKLFEPCKRPEGGGVHPFRPGKAKAEEDRIARLVAERVEQVLAERQAAPAAPAGDSEDAGKGKK